MQDILSTFQKHIKVDFQIHDDVYTPAAIHKFGEDIKGANEFIGTLQSAIIAVKKILKVAQSETINNLSDKRANIEEIINNSSFMGITLFDTQLDIVFCGKTYTFLIQNPLSFHHSFSSDKKDLQELNMATLSAYLEDKLDEMNQILLSLSDALTEDDVSIEKTYSFNNSYGSDFAQMFKGK